MRTCCNCGVLFAPKLDKSYRCVKCKSEYNKQHYEQNKAVYVARAVARKSHVVRDLNELLSAYLLEHPCVDCGEPDPVVLEFDHVSDKSHEVSSMLYRGYSWQALLDEIAKCEVRCANCHRRVTAKRAKSFRYLRHG